MNDRNGYDIEDLHVGMTAGFSRIITDEEIRDFAALSGDDNAIHVDEAYAATTMFRGRVAHGFLAASLISAAVSRGLPGPGSVYLDQQLRFLAPVRPGDTVLATVTVKSTDPARAQVVLRTVCHVGDRIVIDGEATVMTSSSARRARMLVTVAGMTNRAGVTS